MDKDTLSFCFPEEKDEDTWAFCFPEEKSAKDCGSFVSLLPGLGFLFLLFLLFKGKPKPELLCGTSMKMLLFG